MKKSKFRIVDECNDKQAPIKGRLIDINKCFHDETTNLWYALCPYCTYKCKIEVKHA